MNSAMRPAARDMSSRRLALEVFLFFLFLYLLTAGGRMVNRDGEAMFQVTRSIVERGRFDVPSESVFETSIGPRGAEGDSLSFATETASRGVDGDLYAVYGLGQSLASVPFYYAGQLMAVALPEVSPYFTTRFAVALLSPAISALTCAILFLFARSLGFAARTSLVIVLVYGATTLAWPYAKSYASEPLVALMLVLSSYCLVRSSRAGGTPALPSPRAQASRLPVTWLALAGAALGFAVMVRVSAMVLLPVFAAYWLAIVHDRIAARGRRGSSRRRGDTEEKPSSFWSPFISVVIHAPSGATKDEKGQSVLSPLPPQWERVRVRAPRRTGIFKVARAKGGRVRHKNQESSVPPCLRGERSPSRTPGYLFFLEAGAFFLPIGLSLAAIGWYNLARFGSLALTGYQSIAWNRPILDGLYGLLLSPGKGLLWYNPALVVSVLAAAGFYRWRKREALFFAALGLVWLAFHATYRFWEGGWSWGPRLMLPVLPFLVLPLAMANRQPDPMCRLGWRLLPVAVALGLAMQISAIGVDYTRYLWQTYSSRPDDAYARVVHQPAGSPLVQQWPALAAAVGNAVRAGELEGARAAAASKAAERGDARLSEGERSVALLEDTQVAGLNFPDFWFVYLYIFGAPVAVIVSAGLALVAGTGVMIVVLDRRLRELEKGWSQRRREAS